MIPDRGPSLVEATGYIERFRDRIVVVKLGGELLDGGPVINRLLPQVSILHRLGVRPVLAHGGGRQVDSECERRGVAFEKIGGRRRTPEEVMQVILGVVAGRLNREMVHGLRELGRPAFGHQEGSTRAIRCTRRPPGTDEDGNRIDWGEVGDVVGIDRDALLGPGDGPWRIPVLPSVGLADDGSWLNVNADSVSSNVAVALGAPKLVLLTTVAGVMPHPDAAGPISELTPDEARRLVAPGGAAAGGMRAKLEEALKAIDGGVDRVHIVSGREPNTLLREIFSSEGCGTLIVDRRRGDGP